MPAHVPRRSFATPFVITVAATAAASAACHETVYRNPPRTTPPVEAPSASADVPPPVASGAPGAPARDRHWTLTRGPQPDACQVAEEGGQPVAYPCPAKVYMYPSHIVQNAGDAACKAVWDPAPPRCPPTATCNPPPTQVVDVPCPK